MVIESKSKITFGDKGRGHNSPTKNLQIPYTEVGRYWQFGLILLLGLAFVAYEPFAAAANYNPLAGIFVLLAIAGLALFMFSKRSAWQKLPLPKGTAMILAVIAGASLLSLFLDWPNRYLLVLNNQLGALNWFAFATLVLGLLFAALEWGGMARFARRLLVLATLASLAVLVVAVANSLSLLNFPHFLSNNRFWLPAVQVLSAAALAVITWKFSQQRQLNGWYFLGAALAIVAFALTLSPQSAVLMLIGLMLVGIRVGFSNQLFISTMLVLTAIVAVWLGVKVFPEFSDLRSKINGTGNSDLVSEVQLTAANLINSNPLLGAGPVDYPVVAAKSFPVNQGVDEQSLPTTYASGLTQTLNQFGLLGGLALLALAWYFFKELQSSQATHDYDLFLAGALSLLGVLLLAVNLQLLILLAVTTAWLIWNKKPVGTDIDVVELDSRLLFIPTLSLQLLLPFLFVILYCNFVYGQAFRVIDSNSDNNNRLAAIQDIRRLRTIDGNQTVYSRNLVNLYAAIAISESERGVLAGQSNFSDLLVSMIAISNSAVATNSGDYREWEARFDALQVVAKFFDANDALEKAADNLIALAPRNTAVLEKLYAYYLDKTSPRAQEVAELIVAQNPNYPQAKIALARAKIKLGDNSGAQIILQELLGKQEFSQKPFYSEAQVLQNSLKGK
jgi:hypothetical protein